MPVTYPPSAPSLTGDIRSINRFLNDPVMLQRRLRTLAENRYISDALLTNPIDLTGTGSVEFETGESIFPPDNPRAVTAGGEYPLVALGSGVASTATTTNWGLDTIVTDKAIARFKMNPVTRALLKLVNGNVKYVDSVSLAAITTAVTATAAAQASWSTATAKQILVDVALAKANIRALNQGYDADTVVVDDINWAYAMAAFVSAGFFPREAVNANPALTGEFPVIDGMKWLATPNIPTAGTALVLDSTQLGGMGDEDLGGPGYTNGGPKGIQVKSMYQTEEERYRIRCRRVTVPVVQEPAAARKITAL